MIREVDEQLRLWAAWRAAPGEQGGGGNVIGRLIDSKGELVRSSAGARCPWDRTADIELIYTRHLPHDLQTLMRLHYTNDDLPHSMKWSACRCSRAQYYRRLDLLHAAIAELLLMRRAA